MPDRLKRILMVDDELEYIKPYIETLQDEGYVVSGISNVDEALGLLEKNQDFDLITLDMLMPPSKTLEENFAELDLRNTGVWLHQMIREKLALQHIPIIFITAVRDIMLRDRVREIEHKYAKREVIFLTKPLSIIELVETVERVLAK